MILSPIRNRSRFLKPRITQWFGENVDVYAQFGNTGGHSGIDYGVRVGTPVYAPFEGIVKIDKKHKNYGWNIRLKNHRLEAIMAHLSGFEAIHNEEVKMGELIGYTGGAKGHEGSGFSSGPHLHFAVRHILDDGLPAYPQNGNYGWEDLSKYIICWFRTLQDNPTL